ncbi:cadherin-related tumor suppressor [Culicoides brevitarsis]|uniref:cadherin-related tumor suppressor n=1 Tax=Culicoides brevitarsis TaxID=469753 RepID=UPI00307BB924
MQSRSVDTTAEFEIAEGEPKNTLVGYIPTKPGFKYRFNEPRKEFSLDAVTGEIRTLVELDREQNDHYDLVILSSQPTYPIEVRIIVTDINDNSPEFPEPMINVTFSEATPIQRILLDVARDKDIGSNSISDDYKIIGGNEEGRFQLAVTTNPSGDITYLHLETTNSLDRETCGMYMLNISARDNGIPQRYGYLQVNVTVLDVNDNPPIFDHSDYIVTLNDSTPPNTKILEVHASDIDLGINAKINYYLPNTEYQFSIDPDTGAIYTTDKLSCPRRQDCNEFARNPGQCHRSCVFTVYAQDFGSPRQNGRTYVTVNLLDSNDHDPIIKFQFFPSTSKVATVDENAVNGTVVAAISVLDMDEGTDGRTSLKIIAGNELDHFRLEWATSFYLMRVNSVLDREEISKYNVTIVATDSGKPPRSSMAYLIIEVNDENDYEPVFEKSEYQITLSEAAPINSYILVTLAKDEDTGVNAEISYDFVSGNQRQWFKIDPKTGLITTNSILDREIQDTIVLNVSAHDGGPNPKYAYSLVKIVLLDENDEYPKFVKNEVNVTFPENNQPNTLITTLTAVDLDQGTNGSVVYSLHPIDSYKYSKIFAIDSISGRLVAKIKLDREIASSYKLRIIAQDQGVPSLSSEAVVHVTINDINDNFPIIYPTQIFIILDEYTPIGTQVAQVTATDADTGSNGVVSYSFEKSDLFNLDSKTGAIFVKNSVKNYLGQSQKFKVHASDGGNKYAQTPATIQIMKKNDVKNVNFAQNEYNFELVEDNGNLPPVLGRKVGQVKVENRGLQNFIAESLEFFIVDGDPNGNFKVDSRSGVISTAKAIDRELIQQYSLTIVCYTGVVYGKVTVNIDILDVNDQSPTFDSSWDEILLDEDTPVGKDIYISRVKDLDEHKSAQEMIFNLLENPHEVFYISQQGVLYLNKTLQLEPGTVVYVKIQVQDSSDATLASTMTLKITINDVNNHSPVFDFTSYETSLSEGTPLNTRFFLLKASDVDLNENGRIIYEISDGNENDKFGVFPDGYLYVKNQLDREERNYYSLYVTIRDNGVPVRKSTVPIVIHVKDENDNKPYFTNNTFTYTISAGEPKNSFIGNLQANDKDIGRNAELIYAILTNQDDFEVDARTGFIKTLKPLKNAGQEIRFEVSVSDNGEKVRWSDKATVVVTVKDVQNKAPEFAREIYSVNVLENANIGAVIYTIHASDADSYHLISGNELGFFKIQKESGVISLVKGLDREMQDFYELKIFAENGIKLNSTAIVKIHVQDVNDNRPEVTTKSFSSSIEENAVSGTKIAQFYCNDADLNEKLTFSITHGNKRDLFRITEDTGILLLHKTLDYEDTPMHQINVTCSDSGTPSLATTILYKIFVIDINDNRPSFPNTAVIRQIKEGLPINSKILTLLAEDLDSGNNGKIKYSIVNESPKFDGYPFFAINDTTGVIRTLREIDREIIDNFKLTIKATDQASDPMKRLASEKLVTVIVEDVNDNAPEFISMNAVIKSLDDVRDGVLMKIKARDIDASTNGEVSYSLVHQAQNTENLFQINRNTGALSMKQSINKSMKQRLMIRATDEAAQNERKSTDSYLTIILADKENGPVFDKTELVGSVYENEPTGTSILKISAKPTSNNGGNVEYYVTNVTKDDDEIADRLFDVDPKTGILSTASVLDREGGNDFYMVEVTAIEMQKSSIKASSLKVRINILDKNDSPPKIDEPIKFSVSENEDVGFVIGKISATDADLTGHLQYLSEDNKYFKIDKDSGEIRVTSPLDREKIDKFELAVQVTDEIQHTNSTVEIDVIDVNDNAPEFLKLYSFDVPENVTFGYEVGQIESVDSDLGQNAQIKYSIVSNWANDIFNLDSNTGILTVTGKLDYEETQHYILIVQAEDKGEPLSLSSTTTVYCNVIDLNDNAPYFVAKHYSAAILENVAVGTKVMSVEALDEDSGENGRITYSIESGNDKGAFEINNSGELYTKTLLDREETQMYTLNIKIEDNARLVSERLSATTQVIIYLKDVNDEAPNFVSPNHTTVMENSIVNSIVMSVKAVDRDEGNNGLIKYSLYSDKSVPFTLGSNDGVLKVSGPIDHELQKEYYLYVTAHDHGNPSLSTAMNLTVEVLDENDNSPVFDPKHYSASIAENASIGTSVLQVSATDTDEGYNGEVRYSIISGDVNEDFSISEDTGVVRVAKNLNYERKKQYNLIVKAEDRSKDINLADARFDTADLRITIKNINDNIPLFLDSPYVVSIMEETILPNDGYFLTVKAFDADYGTDSQKHLRYFLKEGSADLFSISSTGDISLRTVLDREKEAKHTLTIIAIDSDIQTFTGTGTVHVHVQDINDHAPIFEQQTYFATVEENRPNSVVAQVKAFDEDFGLNSLIKYTLEGPFSDRFDIDSFTGEVRSLVSFDREELPYYYFNVYATDQSPINPRTTKANLTIKILDENDNAPTFNREFYNIYLPENLEKDQFIFGALATDTDEGPNGMIEYTLEGNDADLFSIDPITGIVQTRVDLRDIHDYKFSIKAEDMSEEEERKFSVCTVIVSIKPSKLFPKFISNKNDFSFNENVAKGQLFATMQATSPKTGRASTIKYSIASGNAVAINETTGALSISDIGLDYESSSEYKIWVAATDSDSPPLTTTQMIKINVKDVNDNAPVASKDLYEVTVMEEEYPPVRIVTIEATDKDTEKNAEFRFFLNDSIDESFEISEETGEIRTLKKLDREQRSSYELKVKIVDMGSPAMTGSTTVKVNVLDKNDNPPRFTRLFNVNVTENAEIGFFVIRVTSIDLDVGENANVTYLLSENPGNKFKIDPLSGNVTVAGHLDREQEEEYILKVVATDGAWRSETTLSITIQDVNDCAPIFEHSYYSFNFPEFQKKRAFVGQVVANDLDKGGPNSIISYSLQRPSDIFTIDPASGEIFSKRILHYKQTKFSPENIYSFVVLATDNGKPPMYSECVVNINIIDANNNSPKFLQSTYIKPVLQHTKYGQQIIQVEAVDTLDFGINAEVSYTITGGNGSHFFNINHNDGWISTSRQIIDEINQVFVLQVKAQDRGIPPQSDEALVKIIVSGQNKNTPVFTALSYQVIVPENEPVGSTILTISATDSDDGLNGKIVYSISGGNDRNEFSIDPNTGAVKITKPLDYEVVSNYQLNITAQDLGFISHSSVAMLKVIVTDINDNVPFFEKDEYHAYLAENSPIGSFVNFVEPLVAKDRDSSKFAVIEYSLLSGNGKDLFTIDATTAQIKSKVVFDFEEEDSYELIIAVRNPNSKSFNKTKLKIHITGINEFVPKFVQQVFHFDVPESKEIGTVIGTVKATDRDSGPDGEVFYHLVGNHDKGFMINKNKGEIKVVRPLDRESQSRIILTIMAKNAGSIRGNDTDEAQVVISIQDGNDAPEFEEKYYDFTISEDVNPESFVGMVKATDKDIKPQNNQFSYLILDGNVNQSFTIDGQTGKIFTQYRLDRETLAQYELKVGAIDTGIPPQTGTTVVSVTLSDINDSGPRFESGSLIGYVMENEPPSTSVMTLSAIDDDLPPNGAPFTYTMITAGRQNYFAVDKLTGVVRTTRSIDREMTPELKFVVEVEDNGSPKIKTQHTVIVQVLDKNDNPSLPRKIHLEVLLYKGHILPNTLIGNVRPTDPDLTGNYRCTLLNVETSGSKGSNNEFAFNKDCLLVTTEQTRLQNYTLTIKGNDGLHPDVPVSVYVYFQKFNDETIQNLISIYVANTTIEDYFSKNHEKFRDIIKASVSKEATLKIFSINTKNESIEIIAGIDDAGKLKSADFTKRLLMNKMDLLSSLFQRKVVVGYSPCQDVACENGGTCKSKLQVSAHQSVAETENYVLASPMITNDYECVCMEGYLGDQCKNLKNVCTPNPCQAGGKCRRQGFDFQCFCPMDREGKYCELEKGDLCSQVTCQNGGTCKVNSDGVTSFCICRPGYRGANCEQIIDTCRPNPCQNGGSCIPLKPGYKCTCPNGYFGINCENSSFGFGELSYMLFPELDATTNDISIIFATTKPNSLLIYNYGLQIGGRSDFIALEIIAGKIVFSFGGSQTAITSLVMGSNHRSVADGNWYKVIATRNGRVMSLSVSNCTDNGETCEKCQVGDSNCYTDDIGPTSALNFNKNSLLVGGIMNEDSIFNRPGQVHTDDFIGCIHSIMINGRPLNLNSSIKSSNVQPRCNRVNGLCSKSSKLNTCDKASPTSCIDHWDQVMCACHDNIFARDCETSFQPISLTEGAYVEVVIGNKFRRTQLLPSFYIGKHAWYSKLNTRRREIKANSMTAFQLGEFQLSPPRFVSISFKTVNPNGLLLFSNTNSNKYYSIVELRDGQIVYTSFKGTKVTLMSKQPTYFADGEWHTVRITIDSKVVKMTVDSQSIYEELYVSELHDILDPYLTEMFIGGIAESFVPSDVMFKSFEGCLANFTVNDEVQSLSGNGGIFTNVKKHGKVFKNCYDLAKLGGAQVADPLSIGLSLVIGFIVILLIATAVSFVFFRFHKQQKEKSGIPPITPTSMPSKQGGSTVILGRASNEMPIGYHGDNNDLLRRKGSHYTGQEPITKKMKDREISGIDSTQRSQRPDIIEREVVKTSSLQRDDPHQSLSMHEHNSNLELEEFGHNYDMDNNSSIAPYHYKGFRDGVRKFRASPLSMPGYHKHQQQHRHSPHHAPHHAPFVPRVTPTNNQQGLANTTRQHQTTPLARLSPSSELSSQHPRILTLHDISGKPLQSALLATTSSSGGVGKDVLHSNSERSLNSPVMSQLSAQSSSASRKNLMSHSQKPNIPTINNDALGLTTDEIERLNARQRTSSLVSTLDAVSVVSSSEPRVANTHLPHLHHAQNDAISSTSSDESGNDSFTCSEIEYDNNSIVGDEKYHNPTADVAKNDVTDSVNKPESTFDGTYDSSFRGSLSTVASDDDLSSHIGNIYRQPTAHWDYLLNWGPNFENLVGVFKDIAELPDSANGGTMRLPNSIQKPSEEYV